MPHITIKAYKRNLSYAQKQELADAVSQTIIEKLGAKPESISIDLVEYAPEDWEGQVHNVEIVPRMEQLIRKPGQSN
ncbi:tautomerase family protein [Psittacicella hinzii]|uniref:4-oxalocrotonate tautomerase-like domain-containing protein n=1 Tax=Psittacicella hinzii TaxID=2028575 RepID=A0A3A1YWG0_9GAMM|nr:tautomerase family protein [Psittacicella hinzii]RIY40804.1 hypothetical protein CKF58_00155 [Psittacicella hinzii]